MKILGRIIFYALPLWWLIWVLDQFPEMPKELPYTLCKPMNPGSHFEITNNHFELSTNGTHAAVYFSIKNPNYEFKDIVIVSNRFINVDWLPDGK